MTRQTLDQHWYVYTPFLCAAVKMASDHKGLCISAIGTILCGQKSENTLGPGIDGIDGWWRKAAKSGLGMYGAGGRRRSEMVIRQGQKFPAAKC